MGRAVKGRGWRRERAGSVKVSANWSTGLWGRSKIWSTVAAAGQTTDQTTDSHSGRCCQHVLLTPGTFPSHFNDLRPSSDHLYTGQSGKASWRRCYLRPVVKDEPNFSRQMSWNYGHSRGLCRWGSDVQGEGAQQPASWQVLKNQVLELPSAGWGVQEVRGGDPSHFLSALFWGRQRRKGIDPRQKGTSGQEVWKLWEGGRKETWTLQKPFRRSVHTVESRKARSPVPDPGNWPPVACKWQGAFCYLERRMKPVVRTASGSAGRLAVCERFWGITYIISWSPRGSPVRFITILQKWNLKTRKIRETEKCPR